jgi:hypothetical protein
MDLAEIEAHLEVTMPRVGVEQLAVPMSARLDQLAVPGLSTAALPSPDDPRIPLFTPFSRSDSHFAGKYS